MKNSKLLLLLSISMLALLSFKTLHDSFQIKDGIYDATLSKKCLLMNSEGYRVPFGQKDALTIKIENEKISQILSTSKIIKSNVSDKFLGLPVIVNEEGDAMVEISDYSFDNNKKDGGTMIDYKLIIKKVDLK